MDAKHLTPHYHVSPQITPEDAAIIREAGYVAVICNRPDAENPPQLQAAALRAAVEAQGIAFHEVPLTHQTMTPENVTRQSDIIDRTEGPVLAYCASGTRSSVIWALGQAATQDVDDILAATSKAGYGLDALRPTLMALRANAENS